MNTFYTNLVSKKYSEDDKQKHGTIWDAKNSSAVAVAKLRLRLGCPILPGSLNYIPILQGSNKGLLLRVQGPSSLEEQAT